MTICLFYEGKAAPTFPRQRESDPRIVSQERQHCTPHMRFQTLGDRSVLKTARSGREMTVLKCSMILKGTVTALSSGVHRSRLLFSVRG
jgi:hypothetical protein